MTKLSQYDKRKAGIKIKLLNLTLKHLSSKKFEDINIKDICEEAEVSRVTYFKYFPNKGDILLYFMTIWSYQLEVEVMDNALSGIKAIELAFHNVSKIESHMNVMMGLIGFIARLKDQPIDHQLSIVEKQALFPDIDERSYQIEGKKINIFFEFHLEQALRNKELDANYGVDEAATKLLTLFYGVPFALFTLGRDDLEKNYETGLKDVF